jgi:hypothetical protein
MSTEPEDMAAPHGHIDDSGTARFRPASATKVKLHVTRMFREPTNAEQDIEMDPGTEVSASIADPSASCENGMISSTAHVSNFGGLSVVVVGVAPGNKRTSLTIARDDPHHPGGRVTAHVAADAPSRAFAGLPINGDWVISSPLLPGESCSGNQPVLPNSLIVYAYTSCNGERR